MSLKVLIVDDSTFFAQMLKKSLEPFEVEVTGNAVYSLEEEDARKIASKMMMGMPVETLDEMA